MITRWREWERQRDWLFFGDETDGMYCKLWDTKPRSGRAVRNTNAFVQDQTRYIHEQSELHLQAVKLDKIQQQSEKDGGISACFDSVWEAEEKPLKAALMCLY